MTSPSPQSPPLSIDNAMRAFAIELHQLAYTMPHGHENELLKLSQRMIRHANLHAQRRAAEVS